jgi:hypothetical protein
VQWSVGRRPLRDGNHYLPSLASIPLWTKSGDFSLGECQYCEAMLSRGGTLIATVGLALVFPPTAAAGPSNPNYPFQFKVPATNGYRVNVHAPRGGPVELITEHRLPGGDSMGVAYSVKGKVTRKVMRARFGSLGRLSVRMKWSGRFLSDTQCKHQYTYVVRRARYQGVVRFTGEGGYTSVKSRRLTPALTKPDPVNCGLTLDRYKRSAAVLHARSSAPSVRFAIERGAAGTPTYVFAVAQERLGKVTITRYIEAAAPPSAISFDASLSTAHVRDLPAPFSGTASFAVDAPRQPSGKLSGDLSALFVGGTGLPLTGPSYAAKLEPFYLFDGRL